MTVRTKLKDRILPNYTKDEERMNTVTHIVGGAFSIAITALCIVFSALHENVWAVISCSIYGGTMIALYTASSIYHGLKPGIAKKIMQIVDHCTIFFLIAGTYTPILLAGIRPSDPKIAWIIFGVEWGIALIAAALNAVDLKKFSKLSMVCYIGMGWGIIAVLKPTIEAITLPGFLWLLGGGVAYTIGAVLYCVGKKKHYAHSVFHIFVVIGTVLQFVSIFFYII